MFITIAPMVENKGPRDIRNAFGEVLHVLPIYVVRHASGGPVESVLVETIRRMKRDRWRFEP